MIEKKTELRGPVIYPAYGAYPTNKCYQFLRWWFCSCQTHSLLMFPLSVGFLSLLY